MNNSDSLPVPGGAYGPARRAILQIHPSLRCNLSCGHCYSDSSPTARTELDAATVRNVVADAAAMGYQVISVSGGEPLIYGGLDEVLSHAKTLGLRTTVTTNGFFLGEERLARLRDVTDLLAISLDGPPQFHNEIRGSAHAFERLEAGLENVRRAGIPFGFIHTLTRRNWEHLLWVAQFAAENRASLLQIHPLEMTGRAGEQMAGETVDDDLLARVYVLAFALAGRYGDSLKLQLDLIHRDHLREEPDLVYAEQDKPDRIMPADLFGLLVLEPDGAVVPVSYGFSRRYQVCNVKEKRLADAWPEYLVDGYPAFRALCRQVWSELCADDAPLLSNWHEVIVSRSHAANPEPIASRQTA